MVEGAVQTLMFGRRKVVGLKTVRAWTSTPLAELAPAVFNLRYLTVRGMSVNILRTVLRLPQLLCERAAVLSPISTALGDFRDFQSPILRQKATGVRVEQTTAQDGHDRSENGIECKIEKKLWRILQTNMPVSSLKTLRNERTVSKAAKYGEYEGLYGSELPAEDLGSQISAEKTFWDTGIPTLAEFPDSWQFGDPWNQHTVVGDTLNTLDQGPDLPVQPGMYESQRYSGFEQSGWDSESQSMDQRQSFTQLLYEDGQGVRSQTWGTRADEPLLSWAGNTFPEHL
jgi:hypothetical protein